MAVIAPAEESLGSLYIYFLTLHSRFETILVRTLRITQTGHVNVVTK